MGHADCKARGQGDDRRTKRNGKGNTWHIGEELILMSEHRTRPNDRGSGECLADCSLPGSLGTIELGCRCRRSVEMRYMNQPWNANARRHMGNAPSTTDVYVVIREISSEEVTVSTK